MDGREVLWTVMERLAPTGRAPFQRTLARYLVPDGNLAALEIHPRYAATAERIAAELSRLPGAVRLRWASSCASGVEIALSHDREAFTKLPHLVALDAAGAAVAAHVGGDVYVAPAWRGRGIAAELLLARAVLHDRGRREGFLYSPEGHAAAVASHRLAVTLALENGRTVPERILADHAGRLPGSPNPR